MKTKLFTKAISFAIAAIMLLSMIPMSAFAVDSDFVSETHTKFSSTTTTIAPGVTQSINYAYASDGNQMVYYVATADITRDDVIVQTSYKDQYVDKEFGMQKLRDQIAYANTLYTDETSDRYISEYYNVVAGVNASFYNMTTGQPSGITYLDGVQIGESAAYNNFFAILKDGSAIIDYTYNLSNYEDNIWQAVAGSQVIVWDGEDVTANINGSYNTDRHSRTCVGITADGKVVMMVLDGRQIPFSCGGTMHELAQIMLEQGCVKAINLDGGGSTTYVARQEGEDEVSLVNRPSDGSERTISSGLIIASLAAPSDVFERATLSVEHEYVAPGSTVKVDAVGVSPAGTAAEIPANAVWQMKDAAMGSIVDGVFTAGNQVGDAVIQLSVDGKVVGEKTVHIVVPDKLTFANTKAVISYGKAYNLEPVATYTVNGLDYPVGLKNGDIEFTMSDPAMGTIAGNVYTTASADSAVTSGVITATLVHDSNITATLDVTLTNLPDEPVIVQGFEDGTEFTVGQCYKEQISWEAGVVDSTQGEVHSGTHSYMFSEELDPQYGNLNQFYGGLRMRTTVDLTNVQKLGLWVYIPDDFVMPRLQFRIRPSDGSKGQKQLPIIYEGYGTTEAGHRGWHYFEYDMNVDAGNGHTYNDGFYELMAIEYYFVSRDNAEDWDYAYEYDPRDHQSYTGPLTFYIDDLTAIYLEDIDVDYDEPTFEYVNVTYGGLADAVTMNGQTITDNTVSFVASAKDAGVGLDISSAKAYIDGVEVTNGFSCTDSGLMVIDDTVLANGTHTVTFVISDKKGNCNWISRQITIDADSSIPTVTVKMADETAAKPVLGSVSWLEIEADNIENIDEVSVLLNLNTSSDWEFDGIEVTAGFDLTYVHDEKTDDVTFTFKSNGKCEQTGHAVLAKIPVRMKYIETSVNYQSSYTPFDMKIQLDKGIVKYNDGTVTTFSMPKIDIDSELDRIYDERSEGTTHVHTAVAMDDAAATCTKNGYTGRTFCAGCSSVVNWGTIIPATGHTYEVVDSILKCECGKLFNGVYTDGKTYVDGVAANGWVGNSYFVNGEALTGVQLVDGYYYNFGDNGVSQGKHTGIFFDGEVYRYAQLGELSSGWKQIDDEWYYFRSSTLAAQTGTRTMGVVTYEFEDNGKLKSGVWHNDGNGTRYYYGYYYYYAVASWKNVVWATIDGKTYGFNEDGYRYEGLCAVHESNAPLAVYRFAEDGELIEALPNYTGFVETFGNLAYLDNGVQSRGLTKIGDDWYYFNTLGYAITDQTYYCTNNMTAEKPVGYYTFDSEGKMLEKNGIVNENGTLYYYVNDVRTQTGLTKIGEDYYYVRTGGIVATGTYYCTYNMTAEIPIGTYTFDENGKMLLKNGIVEEDGTLYYYVNNVRTQTGLIKIGEDYYYVRTGGIVATGTYYCTYNMTKEIPIGTYTFDENGKMLLKNGIVEEDGTLYYYVNDVRTQTGLIKIGEDYYYVRTGGIVATGTYYCTYNMTAEIPIGTYTFDENGKMLLKNGIVEENDTLYYYVNNVRTQTGLIKIGEDYYYVRTGGIVATGTYYCTYNMTAEFPIGNYTFGTDGKMIIE